MFYLIFIAAIALLRGGVGSLPRAYPSIRERRRGYLEVLQEHEITTTYFADCHLRREEAYAATTDLLTQNPQITALFGVNDDMALAALRATQVLGKHVPQERYGKMRPSETLRHLWRDASLTVAFGIGNTPVINVMMGECVGGSSVLTTAACDGPRPRIPCR